MKIKYHFADGKMQISYCRRIVIIHKHVSLMLLSLKGIGKNVRNESDEAYVYTSRVRMVHSKKRTLKNNNSFLRSGHFYIPCTL